MEGSYIHNSQNIPIHHKKIPEKGSRSSRSDNDEKLPRQQSNDEFPEQSDMALSNEESSSNTLEPDEIYPS
jgi:hypothetical protein